jgi:putative transposase
MSKRRTHSPELKARVAADHAMGLRNAAHLRRCDPIQLSQWKRQLLDGSNELFTRSTQSKNKKEGQAKEAELFQQIGRLQLELEWLKKVSAVLMSVNYASWSITNTPKSASASNVRC